MRCPCCETENEADAERCSKCWQDLVKHERANTYEVFSLISAIIAAFFLCGAFVTWRSGIFTFYFMLIWIFAPLGLIIGVDTLLKRKRLRKAGVSFDSNWFVIFCIVLNGLLLIAPMLLAVVRSMH